MESLIVFIVGFIIACLIYQNIKLTRKVKQLNKDKFNLETIITVANDKATQIREEIERVNSKVTSLLSDKAALESYLETFITEKIKVYVRSNFHSNYNVYNSKFYAKVNGKTSNSKVEGIPVLTIANNKYSVIDIYNLKKLMKQFPDDPILLNIEQSRTSKEELIQELGNKVLTSYSQ